MKKLVACLLAMVAMDVLDTGIIQAQQIGLWTDYISCLGSRSVCVRYRRSSTSNVWFKIGGIRIWEDPYPYGFGRVCEEGGESTDNIFVFDPGSETTGIGLIGCPVCADEAANRYVFAREAGAQVYTNVQDWENAMNLLH